MIELTTKASDGTEIPLTWFKADQAQAQLLLLPALGIQCKLYNTLGTLLVKGGISVCLMEQRGHGRSLLRANRRSQYGFDQFLEQDIPASLAWMKAQPCNAPTLLGGHSLGGHLSTLYAGQHPDHIDGLLHLACAFPYPSDYQGREALSLKLLINLLPMFALIPGYYPGQLMGFGERESSVMMEDWRCWAKTGRLDYGRHQNMHAAVDAFKGPLLSVRFEKDHFATDAALDRALAPLTGADIERVSLGEAEQGAFLGHTGWAKQPQGVAGTIIDWHRRHFA